MISVDPSPFHQFLPLFGTFSSRLLRQTAAIRNCHRWRLSKRGAVDRRKLSKFPATNCDIVPTSPCQSHQLHSPATPPRSDLPQSATADFAASTLPESVALPQSFPVPSRRHRKIRPRESWNLVLLLPSQVQWSSKTFCCAILLDIVWKKKFRVRFNYRYRLIKYWIWVRDGKCFQLTWDHFRLSFVAPFHDPISFSNHLLCSWWSPSNDLRSLARPTLFLGML